MTTKAKQTAAQTWAALNERQQTWLLEIYRADQDAEEANRTAWRDGRHRQPASVWRWLEYGTVDRVSNSGGPDGLLQERLNDRKVWDQGAGSTMAALVERGLIETKPEPHVLSNLLSIKITPAGRAAARAGGADDTAPARRRPEGLLAEMLWGMLVDVYRAGDNGLQRRLTRGGWEALAEQGLISITNSYPSTLTVAPAGEQHYRTHWAEYARLYPRVDAPNPDTKAAWPVDVDEHLKTLATAALDIRADLHAIARRRLTKLTDPPATPKGATPERAERDRLGRARHKLDTRLQQLLAQHHEQLTTLYRAAVARYVAVAAAVVTAVVAGDDPHPALATEPVPLDELGHAPTVRCPRTGLDGVDRELQLAHHAAVSGPKRHRRRQDRHWEEGAEPCGPNIGAVRRYAEHLRQLVNDGYLNRLLLRRPHHPEQLP